MIVYIIYMIKTSITAVIINKCSNNEKTVTIADKCQLNNAHSTDS